MTRTLDGEHPDDESSDLGETVGRHLEEAEEILRWRARVDRIVR